MIAFVFVALIAAVSAQNYCTIGQSKFKGTCSLLSDCRSNKGTHWIREFYRGSKVTEGCEGAESNIACCYPRFAASAPVTAPPTAAAQPQPTEDDNQCDEYRVTTDLNMRRCAGGQCPVLKTLAANSKIIDVSNGQTQKVGDYVWKKVRQNANTGFVAVNFVEFVGRVACDAATPSGQAPTAQAPVPTNAAPTAEPPTAAPSGQSLSFEKQAYLDKHNTERACYGLPPMVWDNELERIAARHVAKCNWGHSTREFRRLADGSPSGENLSAGSGQRSNPASLVDGWLNELKDWDCARNSCTRGRVCGHYTQLVWESSTRVGCASIVCNTGSPFGGSTWTSMSCNYASAGNFNGRPPMSAAQCNRCQKGLRAIDDAWAVEDYEICVPKESNSNDEDVLVSTDATCACPGAQEGVDADGACAAPKIDLCADFAPRQCADGKTRFPKAPECVVSCPEDAASSASQTMLSAIIAMIVVCLF